MVGMTSDRDRVQRTSGKLSLVDTSDISISKEKKHDFSSGTCEDKITRIFLCFAFCSALGLCLDYDLMLMLMTILMS